MICGVGHRRGLDPTLLWLWHRLAAVAPIGPLAWESLYAAGAALKAKHKNESEMKTFSYKHKELEFLLRLSENEPD